MLNAKYFLVFYTLVLIFMTFLSNAGMELGDDMNSLERLKFPEFNKNTNGILNFINNLTTWFIEWVIFVISFLFFSTPYFFINIFLWICRVIVLYEYGEKIIDKFIQVLDAVIPF